MSTATVVQNGQATIDGVKTQPHHLVWQLRNARKEWAIIFDGVSDEDGERRFGRLNSLGWFMAHLAWHEMMNLGALTGEMLVPELHEFAAKGGNRPQRLSLAKCVPIGTKLPRLWMNVLRH